MADHDAAFREALERAAKCMRDVARNLDHGGNIIAAVQTLTGGARIAEGDCARVQALYAERQGHKHTVGFLEWKAPDGESVRLNHIFTPEFSPGDRVRVTKVEEGQ